MGNGKQTDFWRDKWLGDEPLKIKFSRLSKLSVDKIISVADMYRSRWGSVGEAGWRWRQRLFVWEEELHIKYCVALDFFFLRTLHQIGGGACLILIHITYHLLTQMVPLVVAAHNDVIWNKIAPESISFCMEAIK
jgi:hypothetical protein